MFIEPRRSRSKVRGWIEVVCGSMFSGKTEELIRRLKRAEIAKQNVVIFKPKMDVRYHETAVVSHDENKVGSIPIENPKDIFQLSKDMDVIGVDEVQFFSEDIVEVCHELANQGKRVVVAGLDMDFAGVPFHPMPNLMAIAEYVTKVHAICMGCGDVAQYSNRIAEGNEKVMLGEKDNYQALCRSCFNLTKNI